MIVKLLTEHHLECLSLKGGGTGSSESTRVKMPYCWKCSALIFWNSLKWVVLQTLENQMKCTGCGPSSGSAQFVDKNNLGLGYTINLKFCHVTPLNI